ncbi:MAG: BON domain-containing protein [Chlamydiota bacterium]
MNKFFLLMSALCLVFVSCNRNCCCTPKPGCQQQDQSNSADWAITAKVKKEIMTESSLSASARFISVSTSNGVVTLTGTVASQEESNKAARIARNVSGVSSVNNQLTISNS